MTEPLPEDVLKTCPFCGETGEMTVVENGRMWQGTKYSPPVSVSVRHWCPDTGGIRARMIERVGKTKEDAIKAWNTRAMQRGDN
jgi:formate dehydrogenase maturation protein FdhE